ncbi:MlaA family lipoprotein [Ilyobacter polytropus]|uniref:VacJ family lipoprotein n=1 Tax=Ilyobacter polytropus (strain ATCC 51220 / DSM 2926 / LMG 16218 / CuHBu1) TaxID=572544 RepID=E3H8M7_ILYPC|nr:VacJ family lipoprotein [Ilyobacter polytropus]ADO83009.1 VacJ family lipoprotein [Ilyobacter polytropus DSM 2926]
MKIKYMIVLILIVFGVSCSSVEKKSISKENERILKMKEDSGNYFRAYDPWEPFNRRVYYFNAKFDEYIFLPVVDTYRYVTPNFVEEGVHNFFSNLSEIKTFFNSSLQLKGKKSLVTFNRFTINSTFGILGFFDLASRVGLRQYKEDFGQTLAYYGVKSGPYLVLPLLGPSTLRDATGLGVDTLVQNYADPLNLGDASRNDTEFLVTNSVDNRSNVNFRYYSTGTPFEYEYLRFLYIKIREIQGQN